jgi:23S rRNA pseudouridine1911/1915/1917 synthase
MSAPEREAPREFEAEAGRLDRVTAAHLGIPRADVQRAISEGRVLVDGRHRPKAFTLSGGERITVDFEGWGAIPPEEPAVPVRFEDDHLLVVAKPAGLPTHPTASRRSGTLVNRLLGMGRPLSSGSSPDRPGVVHRLDAGTSGLLVVAKDDRTHALLSQLFAMHDVDRRYLALVRGRVEQDRFAVEAPLTRRGAHIVVRRGQGRPAETELEAHERLPRATLLEAAPRTGRTHQIRVHLAAVGHPVLGDSRYGGGGDDARKLGLTRPFLHSWRLSFAHPVSGELVQLEEPLPEDLMEALRLARAA